jgi:hypothetical protein
MHNNFHSPSLPGPKKSFSPLKAKKKASYEVKKGSSLLESESEFASCGDSGPLPSLSQKTKKSEKKSKKVASVKAEKPTQ